LIKLFIFFLLSILFIACFQKDDEEIAQEIRVIEFQRSSDTSAFERYITSESVTIRLLCAESIAKIGSAAHLHVLEQLLEDTEPRVTKKAIFALGQISNQDSFLISLLNNQRYHPFKKEIILALGKSKSTKVITHLLDNFATFPDSIQSTILQAITYIAPTKYKNHQIRTYLLHENKDISGSAAYFYSRHPLRSAISYLIRANIEPATRWDKYRLKALQGSLKKYHIQHLDSTLHDSLKYRLISDLKKRTLPWQHLFYEISILQHYQDSLSFNVISKYLTDPIPHLRQSAINAIASFDTIDGKSALLHVYQEADWADKGAIILALSKANPEMIYSIIQQNLDKGHTYFKQLLLKSLARINNRMSIRQLRQFLQVPNVRLNLTAYEELAKYGYIGYKHTKNLLLSGDMALTTVAANWIVSHPDFARFEDLRIAYSKFSEPQDAETLLALLQALDYVATDESIRFIEEIYSTTASYVIAEKTKKSLVTARVNLPKKDELKINLFVPEKLITQKDAITASIETTRGDILVELYPEKAPATVSNFIYLANKGFYNNILFHRVVPDFVVQVGDPRGDGWGGPGYVIPCEYTDTPYERGTIGMATAGKDTGSSQFFICHSEQPHLNRRYTVFGKVLDGMDVVDKIEIEDKIIKIVIQN
jgi:cyclophilin family peptidyl-prolyl cis-trans isomerase